MQTDLYGWVQENHSPRGRATWEEQHDPDFYSTITMPVVPADIYADVPKDVLPVVQKFAQRFHLPLTLPNPCSEELGHIIRRVVYLLRHSNRMRLIMDGDAVSRKPDLVHAIGGICKLYREEMLAVRGLRSAAHGVSRVDPDDAARGFRIQTWGEIGNEVSGIRCGHLHIGYVRTEEEAWNKLEEWWTKKRGIDIRVCLRPDSAIAELAGMMRDAAINAGNDCETRDTTMGELWGDEEE